MIEGHGRALRDEVYKSSRTGRDYLHYRKVFDLKNKESLAGKKILDVGAGDSDFSTFVKGKGGLVISLDPGYVDHPPNHRNDSVAGVIQHLPFADGVFDETIASYSLYWVETGLDRALLEMIRVTKDGGLVKIYPTHLLEEKVFSDISCVSLSECNSENLNLSAKTLVIKNNPEITAEEWKRIVRDILVSVTFNTDMVRLLSLGKTDRFDEHASVRIPTYPIPVFKGNF